MKLSNKFYPGPPPRAGWWLTEVKAKKATVQGWRWWNGVVWSLLVPERVTNVEAEWLSKLPTAHLEVTWSDWYPENPRVPRAEALHQVEDGVEHYPAYPESVMRCCDCGLEHRLRYRVFKALRRTANQVTIVPLPDDGSYQVGVTAWRRG